MGSLRLLLALAVVCAHTGMGRVFTGSALAVQLFYMISGFLIAHVLASNPGYQSKATFWTSRALRIYPSYLVVALLTLVFYAAFEPAFLARFGSATPATQGFMAAVNLLLFGQDWAMFMRTSSEGLGFATNFMDSDPPLFRLLLVPQAWSLGVELSFYLLAPFILKRMGVLLLLLTLSLASRLIVFKAGLGWQDPWTYRFFPSELSLFLLGALSQRLVLPRWQASRWAEAGGRGNLLWSLVALGSCALYSSLPLPGHVKGPALVLGLALLLPATFLFNQRAAWDRFLGELSYPVYVVLDLVILVVRHAAEAFGMAGHPYTEAVIVLASSLLLAHALNRIVQAPVERWRNRLKQRRSALGAGRATA